VGERPVLAQRPQADDPGGGPAIDLAAVPDDGDLVEGGAVVEGGKERPGLLRDDREVHVPTPS
jgi:hypothetical protein